jgi:hypothetical protein
VGEECREELSQWLGPNPVIKPEGGVYPIAQVYLSGGTELRQELEKSIPNWGIKAVIVPKIARRVRSIEPVEPPLPVCGRLVQLSEDLDMWPRFCKARSFTSRPPCSLAVQTTDQATLHCPTLQIATPAQMNARRWASMASMVPFIRIEENIA